MTKKLPKITQADIQAAHKELWARGETSAWLPGKLVTVLDLSESVRFRGAYGGRGSGKTRGFALAAAVMGEKHASAGRSGVILCGREFMNSLDDSSMAEVKQAIAGAPWLTAAYDVGERYIRTKDGRVRFIFAGLRHSLDSIKSKARILLAWVDEAEAVSEAAWEKLLPTVREPDSEVWATWNPEQDSSPTDNRFRKEPPDGALIAEVNHDDNPWFPAVLEQQRLDDQRRLDPQSYAWIWEGAYRENSDAQVFAGCYEVAEFTPGEDWTMLQGLDWGFAQDPTAAIRCWLMDNKLFIEREAVKVGLELDATPEFIEQHIPGFSDRDSYADCARPESIRHVKRHGMQRVKPCKKWSGSIEDGIQFIRSFDRVIIHPRCTETLREFRLYSYKTDRLSGEILPKPVDAHNHLLDACRYSLEPLMRPRRTTQQQGRLR